MNQSNYLQPITYTALKTAVRGLVASCAITIATVLPTSAFADDVLPVDPAALIVTITEAAEIAAGRVPGTVVGAEIAIRDEYLFWKIALLDSNRNRIEVLVGTSSGRVRPVLPG